MPAGAEYRKSPQAVEPLEDSLITTGWQAEKDLPEERAALVRREQPEFPELHVPVGRSAAEAAAVDRRV